MTAPRNPSSDHPADPMAPDGCQPVTAPTVPPHGQPHLLQQRRWVIVLAVAASVHLLCDVLGTYLVPLLAVPVSDARMALVVSGLLVISVVVVLFISWLVTLVAGIVVVVRERALARVGAFVILISILASTLFGFEFDAEGNGSVDGLDAVVQAASLIATIAGILQSIALAVGLVMVLIALVRDRAAMRRR